MHLESKIAFLMSFLLILVCLTGCVPSHRRAEYLKFQQDLDRLEEKIRALKDEINNLHRITTGPLKEQMDRLVNFANQSIPELREAVKESQATAENLRQRVNRLKKLTETGELKELVDRLENLRQEGMPQLKDLVERLEIVEKNADKVLRDELGEVRENLQNVTNKLVAKRSLEELNEKIAQLEQKAGSLQKNVDSLKTEISKLQSERDRLQDTVAKLTTDYNKLLASASKPQSHWGKIVHHQSSMSVWIEGIKHPVVGHEASYMVVIDNCRSEYGLVGSSFIILALPHDSIVHPQSDELVRITYKEFQSGEEIQIKDWTDEPDVVADIIISSIKGAITTIAGLAGGPAAACAVGFGIETIPGVYRELQREPELKPRKELFRRSKPEFHYITVPWRIGKGENDIASRLEFSFTVSFNHSSPQNLGVFLIYQYSKPEGWAERLKDWFTGFFRVKEKIDRAKAELLIEIDPFKKIELYSSLTLSQ